MSVSVLTVSPEPHLSEQPRASTGAQHVPAAAGRGRSELDGALGRKKHPVTFGPKTETPEAARTH